MAGLCRSDEGAAPLSVIFDSLREGPIRPSRPRLRNEKTPSHFALQPVSTNTVSAGLFKALMNDNINNDATIAGEGEERRTRCAVRSHLSSRDFFEPARPRHIYLINHHVEPPQPPCFPPRDEHAYSLFSDTSAHPQDISRRLEVHRAAGGGGAAATIKAAQLTHGELRAHTVTKADFEEVQLANLRAKMDEIQALVLLRAMNAATSQALTVELEEALSQYAATRGKERASPAAIVRQRAAKWEQRANEYEAELEGAQLARGKTEDCVAQLEAEHSLVPMQLDEKDAKEHLAKDRESKLRDRVAALEAGVVQLQACGAAVRFKKTAMVTVSVSSPPCPLADSRTSTVYPSPSVFASSRYDWSADCRPPQGARPGVVYT
ncbi:hypothetical protein EDB83DRAFT_2519336 [Lactarius deliciosus]|nr:hypothetical protein EDB83DRAFT_2519336 [Lactarius deliciosus]